MLGMSQNKQNPEGIRVSQQPGGRSSFDFKWRSPEPTTNRNYDVNDPII